MKEKRLPFNSYVTIKDDEEVVLNTLKPGQDFPSKEVRIDGGAGNEEAKDKVETKSFHKSEEEGGEEGLAVLPVAGLVERS